MGTSPTVASTRGQSKSPKQPTKTPPRQESAPDSKADSGAKLEGSSNAEVAKPLAPPPRPGQQQQQPPQGDTPDFFAPQPGGSLSLEPNPFEQSFGGGGPETPGGTKLPSVAALTSPSSLLPGSNATPFNWGGGSLRTGPLSPAMLSGPANDYFGDTQHLRGGFPTPNESSLRSGLTPGGSGSMFPAPSPNSQALFAQLASGGATPSTIDFHRTALSAAAKREHANAVQQSGSQPTQQQEPQHQQHQQQPQPQPQPQSQQQPATPVTSQPQDMPNGAPTVKAESKPAHGPFDPHDNDAANGLFMLAQGAQGRNGSQSSSQYPATSARGHTRTMPTSPRQHETSPQTSNANAAAIDSGRAASEGSRISDENDQPKPQSRSKGKRNPSSLSGRRKADDGQSKVPPHKRAKSIGGITNASTDDLSSDEMNGMQDANGTQDEGGSKSKMTEDEKRKNFLERNRVAALKCRQRKKQWLANLQSKVEMFSSENDALTAQITQLSEEVVNLKTLLLAHKDCPVTQQQGLHGAFLSQVVEPYNAQMNPYGMAGPMPNQPVMAGQGVQRRYS